MCLQTRPNVLKGEELILVENQWAVGEDGELVDGTREVGRVRFVGPGTPGCGAAALEVLGHREVCDLSRHGKTIWSCEGRPGGGGGGWGVGVRVLAGGDEA